MIISVRYTVADEEKREMEIELLSNGDVIIGGHINPPPPPPGLQLVRQVTARDNCLTACQYKGYSYLGLRSGGIDRMDDEGNVSFKFIQTAGGSVVSV